MSVMEDLISFDIIETQKENIQSLPQGRSAKALAAQFGPSPFSPAPTPGATRTLNDAIRQEYEAELQNIADADDPLDIFDRYIKWTMNAYPSAQATPESQLRALLERATKSFQSSTQYKNDVRYLKMWLHYIRFFSDAPRETYAYLSRHGIGDGLALFYEEFSAWLEGAGRWKQAEEVYKLGVEKEARPSERLMRKFGEFQRRYEAQPQDPNEPTSPALPTVRPALAAKLDPFASASTPADPQARRGISSSSSKNGRSKMAIFSDLDGSGSGSRPSSEDGSKGWNNIGTIAERKKENSVEARPWVGETMKAGKKATGPKMMVFKDQPANSTHPVIISTKNGKSEKWFADILSVCPNQNDSKDEFCFEEMRAKHRGWLGHKWLRESQSIPRTTRTPFSSGENSKNWIDESIETMSGATQGLHIGGDTSSETLSSSENKMKSRRKKTMEVKGETQTIKAVLDSPAAKSKLKRKKSSEPTMTLHTRAATDDVLELFNQPLRNVGPIGSHVESDGDTDYDPDDYTCGVSSVGDNTRTGAFSDTESVYNDDETGNQSSIPGVSESTRHESISPWSDFNTRKHVPLVDNEQTSRGYSNECEAAPDGPVQCQHGEDAVYTPTDDSLKQDPFTLYVPEVPEGPEAPRAPFRSAEQAAQNRLPFMTPIVEMTESSMGLPTIRREPGGAYPKTPSRRKGDLTEPIPELDNPLQDLDIDATLASSKGAADRRLFPVDQSASIGFSKPVVEDRQLNPCDQSIRELIMEAANLNKLPSYHDHRPCVFSKGYEIRKFAKSVQKSSKLSLERGTLALPVLQFTEADDSRYIVRRELGKGAYAPVYLASLDTPGQVGSEPSLVAIKSEEPPSPWEFYILSTLHKRLSRKSSQLRFSVARPLAFHQYADEVYLLETYHGQGTLLDLVNLVRSEPSLSTSGSSSSSVTGLDECVAMFFAIEILRLLCAMHDSQVLHGDLKADNCIVRLDAVEMESWSSQYSPTGSNGWSEKGLVLIDFGRGIDLTAFHKDVQFLADWKTSKDDCVEMRELRPWTHQIDYWGAAGILHVLLFGKWIEDVVVDRERGTMTMIDNDTATAEPTMIVGKAGLQKRRLKEGLKRYWQTDLWSEVFDFLMNPTAWTNEAEDNFTMGSARLRQVTRSLEDWLVDNSEKKGLKTQLKRLEDRIRDRRRKE